MPKSQLQHFRNIIPQEDKHGLSACLVCGTGPSLDILTPDIRSQITIIGVNAIGWKHFDPDYLCLIDMFTKDHDYSQRFGDWIKGKHESWWNTKSPYIFTQYKYEERAQLKTKEQNVPYQRIFPFAQEIHIEINSVDTHDCADSFRQGRLFVHSTCTTVALSLAMWMGYKQIGVLGFDLINHHLGQTKFAGNINKACQKIHRFGCDIGTEILNLSDKSRITAFPKATLEQFIAWYGGTHEY